MKHSNKNSFHLVSLSPWSLLTSSSLSNRVNFSTTSINRVNPNSSSNNEANATNIKIEKEMLEIEKSKADNIAQLAYNAKFYEAKEIKSDVREMHIKSLCSVELDEGEREKIIKSYSKTNSDNRKLIIERDKLNENSDAPSDLKKIDIAQKLVDNDLKHADTVFESIITTNSYGPGIDRIEDLYEDLNDKVIPFRKYAKIESDYLNKYIDIDDKISNLENKNTDKSSSSGLQQETNINKQEIHKDVDNNGLTNDYSSNNQEAFATIYERTWQDYMLDIVLIIIKILAGDDEP